MDQDTRPPATPDGASRRRAAYVGVLEYLRVESNPRYQRGRQGRDETYCNLFVADATRALGAPIPAMIDAPGAPRRYLTANAMQDWLLTEGARLGWRRVSAEEAQQAANAGWPTVATWNPSDPEQPGHMAMVRLGPLSVPPKRGPRFEQAGQTNLGSREAVDGFGAARLAEVLYFAHTA